MDNYGKPESIPSDRGSQFYASAGEKKAKGLCEFEKFLLKEGLDT